MMTALPYQRARMRLTRDPEVMTFNCHSPDGKEPLLSMTHRPFGELRSLNPDSLDAWLLERYVAFVPSKDGALTRMQVQHEPWEMQETTLEIHENHLGRPFDLNLDRQATLCHFSPGVRSLVWPCEVIRSPRGIL